VLLSVEGEVKLCDFGVARAREGVTAPGKQLRGGTPGYAAPEGSGDHRGDLYALGATLWVALAGDDPAAPRLEPGRLAARRPDVPPELDALVARAAAERPEARFLSAGELAQALSTLLARRWPGWTPADLGRLVQRHRHAPAPAAEVTGQVRSLALGSIDDRDRPTVAARPTPRPSVGDDAPRERTATFDPAAPRPPEADSSGAPEQTATFAPADALGIAAAPTAILDPPKGEGIAAGPTVIFDAPDDDGLGAPPTGIVAAPTAIRRRAGAGAWAVALLLVAGAATGLGLAVRARGHRSDDAREAPAAAPDSSRADSERAPDDPASHSPPPAAPAETQEVRRELARPIRLPPGVVRTLRDRRATLARARPTEGPRGFLTVSSTPWGAVFVDGKQVADETPLYRMPLPPGEHQVAVRFANSQRSSPPRRVRVAAGAVATVGFVQ
jgi:hypothetical protein